MAARRRRRKKRKNPSTAQWVVLGVGGAVGLGLLGYGIYLAVKPAPTALPSGGGGFGGSAAAAYLWSVRQTGSTFTPVVTAPNGRRIMLGAVGSYELAQASALTYIQSQGGVARSA